MAQAGLYINMPTCTTLAWFCAGTNADLNDEEFVSNFARVQLVKDGLAKEVRAKRNVEYCKP